MGTTNHDAILVVTLFFGYLFFSMLALINYEEGKIPHWSFLIPFVPGFAFFAFLNFLVRGTEAFKSPKGGDSNEKVQGWAR